MRSGAPRPRREGWGRVQSERVPCGGVANMSVQYRFAVNARETASGMSIFIVVPEPASLAVCLLGTCALWIIRRR